MPVCAAAVAALATFYQDSDTSPTRTNETVVRLIAKMPTLAAYSYKHSIGQPFIYPQNRLSYAANFIHMMFATPCEEFEIDPVLAKVMDQLLILHADHEQNCSTSTVRMVGSSQANLYASISAGISALWGPLHGGANQQVIEMLERIEAEGGDVKVFVDRAKTKKDNSRLMGFGHRVYKNYDPRATILRKACIEVLDRMHIKSRQLDIAMKLEDIALKDDYFISHKLYPNVDFYSGIIYKALGIPVNMFTVMFALGRMPGWIAQWLESRQDPDQRIARPRQVYTGATQRAYVPLEKRA
jgi:citrate synthase